MRSQGSANPVSRRSFLLKSGAAVLGVGTLGALAACTQPTPEKAAEKPIAKAAEKPAPAAAPKATGPVTITFAMMGVPAFFPMYDNIVKMFEERYDGRIKVERHFDPSPDHFKVFNKFRAGTAEDVGWINDDAVFFLSSAGSLLILDDYIKRDMNREEYFERVWKVRNAPGDQIATLSAGARSTTTYYNKKLFAEAGVQAPTDWVKDPWTVDQWEENLTKLTKRSGDKVVQYGGQIPSCVGYNWLPKTGVAPYTEDETKAQFNHPEVVELFERMTSWVVEKKIALPVGEKPLELFNSGKLPIMWGGINTYQNISKDVDWGFMPPFKHKVDPTPGFVSDETFSIPRASKHQEEAFQLAKWLLSEPAQWEFARSDLIVPSLKNVAESEKYLNQPPGNRKMVVDSYRHAWLTPTNNPMGEQYAVVMCREDSAMLAGKEKVKEYLDKRVERMNQFIDESRWSKKNDKPGWRLPGIGENTGRPETVAESSPYKGYPKQ